MSVLSLYSIKNGSVFTDNTQNVAAISDNKLHNKSSFQHVKENSNWESLYVSTNEIEQQETLFDQETAHLANKTIQVQRKYLLSSIKSGVVLIHQSLAHQRVLYEEFLDSTTLKEVHSQQLLFPLQLHFSPQDIVIINQLKNDLEHTGFVFSSVKEEFVDITGVPVGVPESEVSIILEQLISDVENEVPDSNFSATDLLAKSMAKSLAIKTGQSLQKDEQEHLVNKLFACKEPNVSPTNRTTFITMSVDELDKKFM